MATSGELGHRERFTKADSESAAFFKRSGSRSSDAAASSRTLAMLASDKALSMDVATAYVAVREPSAISVEAFTGALWRKALAAEGGGAARNARASVGTPALKAGAQNALKGATARLTVGCLHGTDQLASV